MSQQHSTETPTVDPPSASQRPGFADQYRSVVIALLMATVAGMIAAIVVGRLIGNKVVLETAISFALAAAGLGGVFVAQISRGRGALASATQTAEAPEESLEVNEAPSPAEPSAAAVATAEELFGTSVLSETASLEPAPTPDTPAAAQPPNLIPPLSELLDQLKRWARARGAVRLIWIGVASLAIVATFIILRRTFFVGRFSAPIAIACGVSCVLAAALAATAARYLSDADLERFPDARGLMLGARVLTWILVVAAASIAAEWFVQLGAMSVLHLVVLFVNLAISIGMLSRALSRDPHVEPSIARIPALTALGSRWNILAAALDASERQLGIDLRSTWALTVVRRSVEPLLISLGLLAWASTSLTVIGVEEQGLIERLGVPASGPPIGAGLRLHWPWPIDRVHRFPVRRVQALGVGHEGEEGGGPENVLWSVEHAANEFTLLLGNGRDLITVDGAVQFRVVDPRAWRYHTQNPADAIRAFAYRAVMRNTVNRTLSETLSENVALLTARMKAMVQQDADSLGLGVEIVGFTLGGMHPPVAVAAAYEGVVSAQIAKTTAVVAAQAYRNETLPAAQASVLLESNAARAEGLEALARSAGDAWAFRVLEAQYRASPADYVFRRRLETLEKGLFGRPFTILDARFVRDGGEVWVTP